jgi:hypothetical protein
VHTLSEQFNAKPAEIKRLLRGELDPARTRELVDEMRAAGATGNSAIVSKLPTRSSIMRKVQH